MALTKAHNRMIADATINVKDYGAVGDGVTDDSAAIQAAIDAGDRILFPKPDVAYYVETTITVPRNKHLIGEANADTKTILAKQGAPAIWVQGSLVNIENMQIEFDKATLSDFTSTNDVGIRVRDVDATLPTAPSAWPYLTQINIQNVVINKAHTSIDMDAVFWVNVEDCHLYRDFYSLRINRNQHDAHGGGSIPRIATTVKIDRVYCHGTVTQYGVPTGSLAFDITGTQVLEMSHCVTENLDTAANLYTITSGALRYFYAENIEAGFRVFGALSPFLVEQPFITKGTGSLPYCFRVSDGNMTFLGGSITMDGGPDTFYSPTPSNANASATFIKLPAINNCTMYVDANVQLVGGLDADGDIVLGTINSNYKTLVARDGFGPFTSGVTKTLAEPHETSGLYLVYGYSATGSGVWLVMARTSAGATVVSADNATAGTVTFGVDATKHLTITSTGTTAQVLLDARVISLMR